MTYRWRERASTIHRMAQEEGLILRPRDAQPFGWQLVDEDREVVHGTLADLDVCLQDPMIRPRHAAGAWDLEVDDARCLLVRRVSSVIARIRSTTPTTCSWGVYTHDGRMLREASGHNVEAAKGEAEAWLAERGYA